MFLQINSYFVIVKTYYEHVSEYFIETTSTKYKRKKCTFRHPRHERSCKKDAESATLTQPVE